MQEAVNLALGGDNSGAKKKLSEDERNTQHAFQHFLALRQDQGPYTFERRAGGARGVRKAASSDDVVNMIDGRTKVVTLLRLEERVQEILAEKDKAEVTKTRNALKNYDKKREELEEMEELLGL